jgi:chromosomal replication initiator protein
MSTTISQIQTLVAARHGLCVRDILSRRRARQVARPRHIAMWLARHITPCSLPEIGLAFGRDHTTVAHGIDRIDKLMGAYPLFKDEVLGLLDELCAEAGADYRRIAA